MSESLALLAQMESKLSGPLWRYTLRPIRARGLRTMKRTICHAISDAPSFSLGKGRSGAATPRNLPIWESAQTCAGELDALT